jgi:hypothetical protein
MKSIKHLLVVLALAVGLLSLGASAASAAVWKHGGANLAKHTEIGLTGGEVFEYKGSGMSCEVFATITTSGGTTGVIKKWEVKNCKSGFGELAGCEVAATEAKSLNWTIHVEAEKLNVTGVRIRRTFKAGCKIAEIDKTVTLEMIPDAAGSISSFEFDGKTTDYRMFGSVNVNAPNAGTYGIG